jgi:hypothetical protein
VLFDRPPPPFVLAIPADRVFQAVLEGDLRVPPELPGFRRVEAVAKVVTLAVLYLFDQ